MSKNIKAYVKLQVPAGKANPAPPVGTVLGPRGINIMEFCKAFNAQTQDFEPGAPISVVITLYEDKSFTFITKLPPVTYYLKKATGLTKGSSATRKEAAIGKITHEQCKEIAIKKMQDMNAFDLESAISMIKGSAESMGLEIIEE